MDLERLEQLLATKDWLALTDEEKEFIIEALGSEEQYQALRKVGDALVSVSKTNLSPNPSVLKTLRKKMAARHEVSQTLPLNWLTSMRVPAFVSLLLIIIAGVAGWLLGQSASHYTEPVKIVTTVRDTVYVRPSPDTVVIHQIKYRYLKARGIPAGLKPIVVREKETSPREMGVSLKEKQELENFIVAGSE